MKKQILLFAAAILVCVAFSNAQGGGGGFQRKSPEERVAPIHAKFDSAFKLPAAKQAQVDTIFVNFFRTQDAKFAELRAGGGQMDREAMMTARKQMLDDRDAKLKAVITAEQFNTWKNDIEPSMRPPRRDGAGGGNRPQQ